MRFSLLYVEQIGILCSVHQLDKGLSCVKYQSLLMIVQLRSLFQQKDLGKLIH